MIYLLESLSVWLNVVMEDQLIDRTLEHDKHNSKAALNDGSAEHVPLTEDRNSDLVLKVSDAQKFLSGERFDDFVVDPLLEVSDVLLIVFEH